MPPAPSRQRSPHAASRSGLASGKASCAKASTVGFFSPRSSSSTETIFASTLRLPSRRGHPVAKSDRQIFALVSETAQQIDWDEILQSAERGVSRWKWRENSRDFSVFTRERSHNFAVLAAGVVPCSVAELVTVMHAANDEQHVRKMEALHGDQFKNGALVYEVDMESDRLCDAVQPSCDSVIAELAVKTATFAKTNWLHRHEEWCYADAVLRHQNDSVCEKYMTSLEPKDLVAGKSGSRTKFIHGVSAAYMMKAEDNESTPLNMPNSMQIQTRSRHLTMTRVHFYAEFAPHSTSPFNVPVCRSWASPNAVKRRIYKMAQNCERLTQLVRRRRLGVQVLVDQERLLPPTNTSCFCCTTSLLLAKMCDVCGQGVCGNCSQKHERESRVRGSKRTRLEMVRVCDPCLERVDKSNYAHLTDSSLLGPVVFPDAADANPANVTLQALLQDALVTAPSNEKKASVMNVIKCVLDQAETADASATSFSSLRDPTSLSPSSTLDDYVAALSLLGIEPVSSETVKVSTTGGRAYTVDPTDPDTQMSYPVPANEAARLQAIADSKVCELGKVEELNIICDLAAKELGSFASLVTVVTEDEQRVIGANVESLENARFPRAEAFCSHTIMGDRPILIPHPEADVRFHQCGPVKEMGIRYYCGFPLVGDDNETVIGALCCLDVDTHDMTESQYASLSKLAQTAAKVVRIQTSQRRSSSTVRPSSTQTQQ